ncbi:MAG: four helix bundle protein [Chitinophagaceae bacterium]|nr:four helix bundle protein [Chitinophagaceae bacterium]HRB38942.1 four helix bundle protein [Bacteroidia bacterium]HRC02984.1 four helix bundle protein [Niabella sp.]MBK8312367.1 four helix bundle protein [Chitinophagaceae bacterium]MBK8606218.1 four helix bundle protein [Chitinophagaceae bacterium]
MGTFKDLIVYKKAFALAMEIFEMTKSFPKEEKYSLIDQIRRSSRSVCANLGEGYRKRRYVAHFVAKTTDSDMENTETQVWLDFSFACKYITDEIYNDKQAKSEEVGRLLQDMIINPKKYGSVQ